MSLHQINKQVLQVWLWLLGFLLTLLLVFGLALQHPAWQRYSAQQVSRYLSAKLKTEVRIGSFRSVWGNHFVLKNFYLEDQHQDTLLFARSLRITLDFGGLVRNQVRLSRVSLDQALVQVNASLSDSVYNFDFIRAALQAPPAGKPDKSLPYQLSDLQLSQVRLHIQDSVRGNYIQARIGHFRAHRKGLPAHASAWQYRELDLENTAIHFRQTKMPRRQGGRQALDLGFRKMQVKALRLDYVNILAAQRLQVILGRAQVQADTFDLKKARVALASLQVHHSSLTYYQGKKLSRDSSALRPARTITKIDRAVAQAAGQAFPAWIVQVHQMRFRNFQLVLENYKRPLGPQVLDFNHLAFKQLNLDIDSLRYRRQGGTARLQHLSFRDKSGFLINKLTGRLQTRPRQVLIRNALIQTPYSRISPIRQFQYDWSDPTRDQFTFEASLAPSLLHPRDLALLQPYLSAKSQLPVMYRHAIRLQGHLALGRGKIRADHLSVRALSGTALTCSGELSRLARRQPTRLNLRVHHLLTNRQDVPHLLPPGTLLPGMTLPPRMQLSGHFSGSTAALVLRQVQVKTADGAILETSGTLRNLGRPQKWIDLQVKQYRTSRAALLHLLPPHTVSPNLQLPDKMVFSGTFRGASLHQFRTQVQVRSSFGDAALQVVVRPGERFSGSTRLTGFELGKFLREEKTLGQATGQVSFSGQGLTFATTRLQFHAAMRRIIYNGAPYRNIQLQGTLDHETYRVQGGLAKVAAQTIKNKLKKLKPKKSLEPQVKKPQIRKKLRLWKRNKK